MGRVLKVDLICRVVDNYGDIAVVWRLAQALVEDNPQIEVRILVDDWQAFELLAPQRPVPQISSWPSLKLTEDPARWPDPSDVLVEAFGASAPQAWLDRFLETAPQTLSKRLLIHLEYLSAEPWTEEYHLLPSPMGRDNAERVFFVPGFLPRTGGLIFTDRLPELPGHGSEDWLMTLFGYEHDFESFWTELCDFLGERQETARVLVFAGRSRAGALDSWERVRLRHSGSNRILVVDQPFLNQDRYTALLQVGDFHVVRGEESWVQALLSGKAFLWHAYLQPDGHQMVKVDAFLEAWRPWFDAEGPEGRAVFTRVAQSFRQFNDRLVNSTSVVGQESYRVFWENRDIVERVGQNWASSLRKNAKLSRKMLEFFENYRI